MNSYRKNNICPSISISTVFSLLSSNHQQDFTPRINLSEEDFAIMTRGGQLLDEDGLLSIEAFEVVLKDQVKRFVQRQLTNILAIGRCSDAEEVQLSTMKAILHEQVAEHVFAEVHERINYFAKRKTETMRV
jgi:hypothetical protein